MKNVLIIAYAFPPIGGVGAIRIVKFAKYLAEFGWRPVILTVNDSNEFVIDDMLQDELANDLSVYRTRIWEPLNVAQLKKSSSRLSVSPSANESDIGRTSRLRGAARSYLKSALRHLYFALRIPDDKIGWWPFAVRKGLDIIGKENVDLIFATTPPYTALLIGQALKRKSGIPFVVDYRDEWSTNQYRDYPSNPVTRTINRWLEKRVLQSADAIVGLSDPLLRNLENEDLLPQAVARLRLPNGYDSADYEIANTDRTSTPNELFTLTYTGSFYGERQSPKYFLAALAQLLERQPELRTKITVRFVGSIYPEHERLIAQNGVNDIVQVVGVVSHEQATIEQQSADLLLLIIGNGSGENSVLTGKIFEYLGAGCPILALVPEEGAAAEVIKATSTGYVVGPSNIVAIQEQIEQAFDKWQSRTNTFHPNFDMVQQYERKVQTKKLATFFNQVAHG